MTTEAFLQIGRCQILCLNSLWGSGCDNCCSLVHCEKQDLNYSQRHGHRISAVERDLGSHPGKTSAQVRAKKDMRKQNETVSREVQFEYQENVLHTEGGQALEQAPWGSCHNTKTIREQHVWTQCS